MRSKHVLMPAWHVLCESIAALEQAIMPVRCAFCGVDCKDGEQYMCAACDADLPRIRHSCATCAQVLVAGVSGDTTCADCQRRPSPFVSAQAALAYEFPVDAAIKRFKYRRRLHYVPAFGALLCRAALRMPDDIDAILPVPLHWIRHGIRGFNQASEISRPLQKLTGLPVISNVRRVRATPPQSGLTAKERRRNLKRAFAVRGVINAKHILIVDDVITTGETCRQIARLLLDNGAEKISVLALARAVGSQ